MLRVRVYQHRLPHADPYLAAFAAGLKRHGVTAVEVAAAEVRPCDLAVFWGARRPEIVAVQKACGGQFLVAERAYLKDRFGFCSLGYGGLNGRADFCNAGMPGDRWDKHFAYLMRPWRAGGRTALLLGQVRGDASIEGADFAGWLDKAVAALRAAGHDVRYRPHPQDPDFGPRADLKVPRHAGTLDQALSDAQFAATWNSNSGVDAVLAGVPTIACDKGSMAWAVAGHSIDTPPPMPDRTQWAQDLAYCQWTEDEIAQGEAWAHLRRKFN